MPATDKKKLLAIINPISGTDTKEYIPEILDRIIDKDKFNLTLRFTQRQGHATELTQAAILNGFHGVIAVGGDGTINEVASALCDSDTALGIIPCGSGNGLARHLGVPVNIEKAIQVLNADNVESLDYCTVNDIPFFCTCGVGFDAHVSEKFAQSHKRGALSYVQNTLIEYLKYRPQKYTIEMGDEIVTEEAFLIACGNASQYGNNAFITPGASMHDGLIDVTVIHPFTPLDTAIMSVLLFTRHIDQDININTYRTDELVIKRDKPGVMHIDGDPVMMDADLHIKCHKGGIKMLLPTNRSLDKSFFSSLEDYFWEFVNTVRGELKI
ncbi:MAG: diacylglycerol kinase family lipid kinase [Muribaculaceae bacterium]|nr:diacylglycerol kinase family lipid kinase [Muribaculaceae bacterium]